MLADEVIAFDDDVDSQYFETFNKPNVHLVDVKDTPIEEVIRFVLVTNQLEQRVSRLAEGDSTAKRRELKIDIQLQKAVAMLEKAQSQRELFTIASAMTPPAKPKQ